MTQIREHAPSRSAGIAGASHASMMRRRARCSFALFASLAVFIAQPTLSSPSANAAVIDAIFESGFDPPCSWPGACGSGAYCRAKNCSAGECKPVSVANNGAKSPVCGCDGVDYWNATTAATFGMAVASSGACAVDTTCGGLAGSLCPAGRTCTFQYADASACNLSDASGVCWGMPATCDAGSSAFRVCGSPSCTGECTARASGAIFFQDNSCLN